MLPSNGAKIDGIIEDAKKKEDCKIVKKEKMPVLIRIENASLEGLGGASRFPSCQPFFRRRNS